MDTFIYTLSDPDTGDVRYIGKANNLVRRLTMHILECKNEKHRRARWINNIVASGKRPIIEILDVAPSKGWELYERYWISQFRAWGFDLVNGTDGGDGTVIWTAEMRENMSGIKKGQTPWNKNTPMSSEAKQKLILTLKTANRPKPKVKHTDEFKEAKSKQMSGYYATHAHPRLGKRHTIASIEQMKETRRRNKLLSQSL